MWRGSRDGFPRRILNPYYFIDDAIAFVVHAICLLKVLHREAGFWNPVIPSARIHISSAWLKWK